MQTVVYFEESLVIIYYKGKQKTRRVSHKECCRKNQ